MDRDLARRFVAAPIFAALLLILTHALTLPRSTEASRELPMRPIGRVEIVERAYAQWLARRPAGDWSISFGLAWSKGLSAELTRATGVARFERTSGRALVEIAGLIGGADVWVVDNRPGPGRSVRPELGDEILWLGRIGAAAPQRLEVEIAALTRFEIDLVVVTRSEGNPIEEGLLYGAPSLFQRIRESQRTALRVGPAPVRRQLETLVERGSTLFFDETFAGNGRTCGTCHPAENDLTIDPSFIAALPDRDPLFVAEFIPELAENFENPLLMRQVGLILENLDGFDDLENRFVMRGVPHTLALGTSLAPAPDGADGTTIPPDERTGWSGDGSPGSGTLREFAIGAVRQHFTRTLGRLPGTDFRFPTDEELDALEAFQLSLGRDADPDLAALVPRSEVARRGLEIFLAIDTERGTVAAGKCNLCHANAGAAASIIPGGFNFNFDTGVERLADAPADLVDPGNVPPDGGFGTAPDPERPGAFGNGTFNTPPLVEAADTGPFFHDNSVETIEQAVAFYDSQAFAESPSGQFLASTDSGGIGIRLEATQVVAVAALLRVLNALENLRSAEVAATRALGEKTRSRARPPLAAARGELRDAADVLRCAGLHPEAVASIENAESELARAAEGYRFSERCDRIERALAWMAKARGDLVE